MPAFSNSSTAWARARMFSVLSTARCMASPTSAICSPTPDAASEIRTWASAAEAQVKIGEAASGVGEEMADVGMAMQRAMDKTENMRARAQAVDELEKAGTFEDLTQLGSGEGASEERAQ